MSKNISGQSKKYFDEYWKETTENKAKYYRITLKKNDSLFHVKDYYINNILQMDGFLTDLKKETKTGLITFYDEKGRITNERNYNAKGELHGLSKNYLKNGKIDYTTDFKNGEVYDGIYKGEITELHYNKGTLVMTNEEPKRVLGSKYMTFKKRIYGKEIDTVYWTNYNGKFMGKGTYKHKKYKIINGIDVSGVNLNTFYTNHLNGIKEGIRKVYFGTNLIAEHMFVNDKITYCKSIHPLTQEKIHCDFKDEMPFNGRIFLYDFVDSVIDDCKGFIYKNGKKSKGTVYRGANGIYKIYKP